MFLLGLIAKLIKSQARFPAESTGMLWQHRATEALESHTSCVCVLCLLLAQMPTTIYHLSSRQIKCLVCLFPEETQDEVISHSFPDRLLLSLPIEFYYDWLIQTSVCSASRKQLDLRNHSRQQAETCLKYSCITWQVEFSHPVTDTGGTHPSKSIEFKLYLVFSH